MAELAVGDAACAFEGDEFESELGGGESGSPLEMEGEGLASILESRSVTKEEAEEATGEEEALAGEEVEAREETEVEAGEEAMATTKEEAIAGEEAEVTTEEEAMATEEA